MITPIKPLNEAKRLEALESYQLLDTLPEDAYDTVTMLASHICDTPISLVTLLDADRNFLKSRLGVDMVESPRDISFCGHAILTPEPIFIVEDARLDKRFKNNPLVKDFKAIFYAGIPLRTSDGYALGTLCVYDHKPRKLTEQQKVALQGLARQVILLFEAHRRNIELESSRQEVVERNDRLEDFARLIAHDLKSPLVSIEGLLSLLKEDYPADEGSDLEMYFKHLDNSSKTMRAYIDGLLDYYRSDNLLENIEDVELSEIVSDIKNIHESSDISITLSNKLVLENIPKFAVEQIISNLVDNAIKYNDKEITKVEISSKKSAAFYSISITDNGTGIPKEKQGLIFELFKTTGTKDRNGNKGTGMGLATVKKLVEGVGGKITVSSTIGEGSIFTFTIRR